MRLRITNGTLSATVDTFGAELKSLRNESQGIEHIWQADPQIWRDSAPLLFPVVARQLDDRYTLNGSTYTMPMHGFARMREFTLTEKTTDSVTLMLSEDAQTLEWYPFRFRLQCTFRLSGNKLLVTRTVENRSDTTMLFSLGEHPGYRVPMTDDAPDDYVLEFSSEEHTERWLLDDEIICAHEPFSACRTLPVTPELFDRGALILKELHSEYVTLRSRTHSHNIRVGLKGWRYLGIWAKPNAPYVCIEPWNGLASSRWSSHALEEKEGICKLDAGASRCFTMEVAVDEPQMLYPFLKCYNKY